MTNSSRSAFFLAKLRPHSNARTGDPGFFTRYKPLGSPRQQRNGVKCMLLVRVRPESPHGPLLSCGIAVSAEEALREGFDALRRYSLRYRKHRHHSAYIGLI